MTATADGAQWSVLVTGANINCTILCSTPNIIYLFGAMVPLSVWFTYSKKLMRLVLVPKSEMCYQLIVKLT